MDIKSFEFHCNDKVSELLGDCVPYVLPHHPYVYWILSEYYPSLCYVAQEDGDTIGFVCALHSTQKNCAFIWQLAVDKEYRRSGVALSLCNKIVEYARDNRLKSIQITINDENAASARFFKFFAEQSGSYLEKIELAGLCFFEKENAYEIKL